MKLETLLKICSAMTKRKIKENPAGAFKAGETRVPFTQILSELEALRGWCYPDLDTGDLCQVVRCKNCHYYKPYTQSADSWTRKHNYTMMCTKGKMPVHRPENFYCADGAEKGAVR